MSKLVECTSRFCFKLGTPSFEQSFFNTKFCELVSRPSNPTDIEITFQAAVKHTKKHRLNVQKIQSQNYLVHCNTTTTTVAQWLRCCATNRKVAGSIPAGVSGFFIDVKSLRSHYGPWVDSASNRNEYQEYFLRVKAAGA